MKYTSYEKKPRFVLLFFFFSLLFYTSYMLYFKPVCMYTYVSNNETVLQEE